MSADFENEIRHKVSEIRQKYTHFLLAAVGACIGFAITQSKDTLLTFWVLPLGIALLMWGLSFYLGCRYLHYRSVALDTNAEIVKVLGGRHHLSGHHPEAQQIGLEVLYKNHDSNSKKSGFCYRWQLRFFVVGTVCFLIWHILEMWIRTAESYKCLLWF